MVLSLVKLFHNWTLKGMSRVSRPYSLSPLQLGCEVTGIDLAKEQTDQVIELIRGDVRQHRILVFRGQERITPERHLEIGGWFGEIESTFYDHPKSPLRDIFRVSNDRSEGCTGVGRTGWHIDGSFQEAPFTHSLYHIIETPRKGGTTFCPLTEIVEGLTSERRSYWDRLWMMSDRRSGPKHPLIYSHPETGKPVLCFHLGMTEGYILDLGKPHSRVLSDSECQEVFNSIQEEICVEGRRYNHVYQPGDFIISDNLSVGHEAHPDTQLPREQVGLRVMHRVTIKGKIPPTKKE